MVYKIIETRDDDNGVKTTTVEFKYNDEVVVVDISHFQPSSEKEIEIGIVNRINSEIRSIDASTKTKSIVIELGVERETKVLSKEEIVDSTYVNYTTEELNQKLDLLNENYNLIQSKIMQGQSDLADNSADYDLVIAELLKRSN